MPVGTITRNSIEGNSVGVGFYGYSGFSGWSGIAGGQLEGNFTGWSIFKVIPWYGDEGDQYPYFQDMVLKEDSAGNLTQCLGLNFEPTSVGGLIYNFNVAAGDYTIISGGFGNGYNYIIGGSNKSVLGKYCVFNQHNWNDEFWKNLCQLFVVQDGSVLWSSGWPEVSGEKFQLLDLNNYYLAWMSPTGRYIIGWIYMAANPKPSWLAASAYALVIWKGY